ncbi:PREDICTED: pentatricopeptide repeat-containing protein At5g15280 [Nelumbo nucifera]|uniref:Pentatricopeptide repeat-containing protein At5g15280 n=2 Tax=Nelumbo nucifera TaxID=4432 RepID=A0A1U8A8L8_NELNU|nr:PREDICTED: pentatricopeptide repeat-containing protein At5g15280 [Nelumbo nucifera]XP_010258298.1 PREDICTED: pentatricopeptide repeat-containing protein At5g15280 [Nelumbo nucifera]DAD31296.1 TPA_asm: hypothetical protein HUJ06_010147 [Nelumbo nucifera]
MRITHKVLLNQLQQISSKQHVRWQKILFNLQVCCPISHPLRFFCFENSYFRVKSPPLKLGRSNPSHKLLFYIRGEAFSTNQTLSCSIEKPTLLSGDEANKAHLDLPLVRRSVIGSSVISRCSYLWEKKGETIVEPSLKYLLLKLSDISPASIRRFWRVSILKPEDVLDIFLGFKFDCGESVYETEKVELLWELFQLAKNQGQDFEHLPRSYNIMVSMLIQVGSLSEAKSLLQTVEALPGSHEFFSKISEGYASRGELESSILMYNEMRDRGIIPSLSCYQALLNLLVRMQKSQLAFRVYIDMIEAGFGLGTAEQATFELVVRLLCKDKKIQEARNLVKKVTTTGLYPSQCVVNAIANGYCGKKDFEDLLSFLSERKCVPDASICNKVVYSLCRNFGTKKAYIFMQDLELLGFRPDDITFGILIGWSCREGKLKDAFIYLSELSSRCLRPNIHSYNAIICGLFKEGMWKHASGILDEMLDKGIRPNLSTFKILLAGYCKDRLFNEAKVISREMVKQGLVQLTPSEDLLPKAFMLLGLNPLSVKIKRDNDERLSKAEFFDSLGNGLYLETNLEEYEKTVRGVLEDSMVHDYNQLILNECSNCNTEVALKLKDEMIQAGQELSLSVYSALVKSLFVSRFHFKAGVTLLEEMPERAGQLNQETLNCIIRAISKKGFTNKGGIILDGMIQRCQPIENDTFTALIMGFCKEKNLRKLNECWELAQENNWLPRFEDCKPLLGHLCLLGQFREALELLKIILESSSHSISDICNTFIQGFCISGFTNIGHILLEEVQEQGWILDQSAYNHLIRGFCKEKKFTEALELLDTMLGNNMSPSLDVLVLVAHHPCRSFKLEKIMALKEIMLREQPAMYLSVYKALTNWLCDIGEVGEAAILFQEMLAKGVVPDAESCNVMVQGFCKISNLTKVRELLGMMIKKNFSLSILSYRNLVCLMCLKGRLFHALNIKSLMLREINSTSLVVYNILILHLFRSGYNSYVTTLLGEMQKKNLLLDKVTYNFLVHGYYKCKDVPKSVQTLETMIDKGLKPSNRSLTTVIRHYCTNGELNKALELSKVMQIRGWVHGSVIQNSIAEGLLSQGRLQEAEIFLDQLRNKGLIPNCTSYDVLIKRFCGHGRINKAVDLINIMLKKGNIPCFTSYDSVIQGLCNYKALGQALDFHSEMLNRNLEPGISSWDALVSGLCADGQTAKAEMLLDSMHQLGLIPTQNMYHIVINRYCLENHLQKASNVLHKMQRNGYVPDFDTHWFLISNLNNSNDKDGNERRGFLSRLLSQSGFTWKNDLKAKKLG